MPSRPLDLSPTRHFSDVRTQQVNRLAISPDKRYIAAACNRHILLYDVQSQNTQPAKTFEGHTSNVTAVAWHCEGKWFVTGSEDGTLKIWDTRSVPS